MRRHDTQPTTHSTTAAVPLRDELGAADDAVLLGATSNVCQSRISLCVRLSNRVQSQVQTTTPVNDSHNKYRYINRYIQRALPPALRKKRNCRKDTSYGSAARQTRMNHSRIARASRAAMFVRSHSSQVMRSLEQIGILLVVLRLCLKRSLHRTTREREDDSLDGVLTERRPWRPAPLCPCRGLECRQGSASRYQ